MASACDRGQLCLLTHRVCVCDRRAFLPVGAACVPDRGVYMSLSDLCELFIECSFIPTMNFKILCGKTCLVTSDCVLYLERPPPPNYKNIV